MIKFITDSPQQKHKMITLGLSHKNLKKLKQGLPIVIDMEKMGYTRISKIMIFSGETEQTMKNDIDKVFDMKHTKIHGTDGQEHESQTQES